MAFLRLAFFPEGTDEHWRAVVDEVGDIEPRADRRAFVAGPVDGGWQVMQLWDDRAGLDRFNERHFLPALARLDRRGFPRPPVVRDVETVVA